MIPTIPILTSLLMRIEGELRRRLWAMLYHIGSVYDALSCIALNLNDSLIMTNSATVNPHSPVDLLARKTTSNCIGHDRSQMLTRNRHFDGWTAGAAATD